MRQDKSNQLRFRSDITTLPKNSRICVLGDSFADRYILPQFMPPGRKDESWMQYLEDQGYYVESHGKGGTSTWYSYDLFLGLRPFFDAIIFVYSHHTRIHTMPKPFERHSFYVNHPELITTADGFDRLSSDEQNNLITMIKGAYLTKDKRFDVFVLSKIFEDVNRYCRKNNIKLINILPFEDKESLKDFDLSLAHGDVLYNLIPSVLREMDINGADSRHCHLSLENNIILGRIIEKGLQDRPPKFIDLTKEANFVFSEEITQRYQNLYK